MKSSELEVIENSSSDDVGDLSESNSDIRDNKEMETRVKEDIYGRLLPDRGISHTGASKAYVPPGKRHQLSSGGIGADGKKQLELVRLKKQLKGLLNRCVDLRVIVCGCSIYVWVAVCIYQGSILGCAH